MATRPGSVAQMPRAPGGLNLAIVESSQLHQGPDVATSNRGQGYYAYPTKRRYYGRQGTQTLSVWFDPEQDTVAVVERRIERKKSSRAGSNLLSTSLPLPHALSIRYPPSVPAHLMLSAS